MTSKLLALDLSTRARHAVLVELGESEIVGVLAERETLALGDAEPIDAASLVLGVLADARVEIAEISGIAVGLGPGGTAPEQLDAALEVIAAMAVASERPLLVVSSLAALAHATIASLDAELEPEAAHNLTTIRLRRGASSTAAPSVAPVLQRGDDCVVVGLYDPHGAVLAPALQLASRDLGDWAQESGARLCGQVPEGLPVLDESSWLPRATDVASFAAGRMPARFDLAEILAQKPPALRVRR